MKIFASLIIIFIQSCLMLTIKAINAPWFEIEVLIFEQSTLTRLNSEKWDQLIALPDTAQSVDFITLDPSLEAVEQICVRGNIVPVLEVIPVTEVLEEIEVSIANEPMPAEITSDEAVILNDSLLMESIAPMESEAAPEPQPFSILEPEFNQLNDMATTLKRSRGFRPLLHISWRQPVENKKESQLIRLYAGKNYSDTFNPAGDARVDFATMAPLFANNEVLDMEQQFPEVNVENTAGILTSEAITAASEVENINSIQQQLNSCKLQFQKLSEQKNTDVWQLDGNIRIYVERYLHLETDLMLRIPGKEELELGALETSLAADRLLDSLDLENTQYDSGFAWQLDEDFLLDTPDDSTIMRDILNKYQMRQSRRIRSKEIHYIDHPLFGLLIQIRPFKIEMASEDS